MRVVLLRSKVIRLKLRFKKVDPGIDVINTNRKLVTDFFAKEFPQIQVIDLEATYLL